jgi:nucleotide-binding universal stress UspA family protein
MPHRIAYLPLDTHPEAAPDPAILAALGVARGLGARVHAAAFAVAIPPVASPLGGYLINIEGMARAAEERSRAECARLGALVAGAAGEAAEVATREAAMGGALAAAAVEARLYDLSLVPWSADSAAAPDMAQALVFGTGLPVVLVPPSAGAGPVDHIAIAWDESRVAARALGDALALLAPGGRVTVLTVQDEKPLARAGVAATLADALTRRGHAAQAVEVALKGRTIAAALQEAALAEGAQMLAMGAFGHSRLRDFVLGGATRGVLADLRMPVLLAH